MELQSKFVVKKTCCRSSPKEPPPLESLDSDGGGPGAQPLDRLDHPSVIPVEDMQCCKNHAVHSGHGLCRLVAILGRVVLVNFCCGVELGRVVVVQLGVIVTSLADNLFLASFNSKLVDQVLGLTRIM